jgi:AcrR family transcriptional regulator
MTEPVKPTRRYDSPRRREQAAATRREILEAAQRLFEEQGYVATTMAAIAAEAGVALKTVYVAFETKAGILRALWHLLLRGDEADVPVLERPWYRELLAERNAERQLRRHAEQSRATKERIGTLLDVIRAAAAADRDSAALWDRIQSDFHEMQRGLVESLAARGALRPGLDVDRATDILWTLNNPDVWQLLVGRRGWTPAEYEEWLAEESLTLISRRGRRQPPSARAGR